MPTFVYLVSIKDKIFCKGTKKENYINSDGQWLSEETVHNS